MDQWNSIQFIHSSGFQTTRKMEKKEERIYGPHIGWCELLVYTFLWIGAVGYSCVAVYQASRSHQHMLTRHEYFEDGWLPSHQMKDYTDFEWSFWSLWARTLLMWAVGHVVLAHILPRRWHPLVLSLYTLTAITVILGYRLVGFILAHILVMYAVTFLKSVLCVWLTSMALISILNVKVATDYLQQICEEQGLNINGFYLLQLLLSIENLHYTSFALDKIQFYRQKAEQKSSQSYGYSLPEMLHFMLYFPIFFTGPVVTYNTFKQQYAQPATYTIGHLFKEIVRLCFWAMFCEVILHYFYFASLQSHGDLMNSLPLWAVGGTAYCVGNFFMVKYVVLYGFPSFLLKLDGLTPPEQPQCVSHIYFYSEMWKNFDRGLYIYLKTYIYVPLGGSQRGLLRQLLASFCCFMFVYIWHGGEHYLFIWVFLNFISIALESIGKQFCKKVWQRRCGHLLSPAWTYRVQAFLAVPVYIFNMTAVFIFLCGSSKCGVRYARRLLVDGWPVSTITFYLACYGCVHLSNYIAERRNYIKQKKE